MTQRKSAAVKVHLNILICPACTRRGLLGALRCHDHVECKTQRKCLGQVSLGAMLTTSWLASECFASITNLTEALKAFGSESSKYFTVIFFFFLILSISSNEKWTYFHGAWMFFFFYFRTHWSRYSIEIFNRYLFPLGKHFPNCLTIFG